MRTIEIQRRLIALGFDPGPADGVSGRLTIRAIKAFQASRHLEVDGIVGPQTLKALTPEVPQPIGTLPLPWFEEAEHLEGTKEVRGSLSNPIILQWADDLDIHYPSDDVPWCGLFVAHCIGSTLPNEILPSNPFGARNWRNFGIACDPQAGAVLVFWRTHKTKSFNGHVGFYAGEDGSAFHVLGGNQSDSVSVARVAKDRLLAARWPATVPFLATGRIERSGGGDLSRDEA